MHTTADHMYHTSRIMCIVTVWHPSIGNIIPILGYVTLDIPVTVVTSGELRNRNRAVSETETWQPYGACISESSLPHCSLMRFHQYITGPIAEVTNLAMPEDLPVVQPSSLVNSLAQCFPPTSSSGKEQSQCKSFVCGSAHN